MHQTIVSWVVAIAMTPCSTASLAEGLPRSIFAIERYNTTERSYLTEPYGIFCLHRPGFMVEICMRWGMLAKVVVELICKKGYEWKVAGYARKTFTCPHCELKS